MRVKTEHRSETERADGDHPLARYLVVGREGCLPLGNLLSRLLKSRGLSIEEMISFDHSRKLTLYKIQTKGAKSKEMSIEVDLMICLNDVGLDYERLVKRFGTLLIDANSVTRCPGRTDIDIVSVPAFNLVQDIAERLTGETTSRFDPSLSSILGSIEAIENEYPDSEALKQVFEKLQIGQTGLFLMGVYRGYDWLQETRMRGKTAWGGVLN